MSTLPLYHSDKVALIDPEAAKKYFGEFAVLNFPEGE